MGAIASKITSLKIVYSTVYSDTDQRKHQSSASLAFVWGIHRRPVNSPHKWPVTRKMFPFDDVIMNPSIIMMSTLSLLVAPDVADNDDIVGIMKSIGFQCFLGAMLLACFIRMALVSLRLTFSNSNYDIFYVCIRVVYNTQLAHSCLTVGNTCIIFNWTSYHLYTLHSIYVTHTARIINYMDMNGSRCGLVMTNSTHIL